MKINLDNNAYPFEDDKRCDSEMSIKEKLFTDLVVKFAGSNPPHWFIPKIQKEKPQEIESPNFFDDGIIVNEEEILKWHIEREEETFKQWPIFAANLIIEQIKKELSCR